MTTDTRESLPLLVEQASKHFGNKAAFTNVSFRLRRGNILSVAGPNGGGKTTLMRCLVGIYHCDEHDSITLGLRGSSALARRRRIAYAPDDDSLIDELTGREYLEFVADTYDMAIKPTLLRAKTLLCTLKFHEPDLTKLIRTYSHGMRKKLQLASTLMVEAPLTLIDEPTNGLDPSAVIYAKQIIKEATAHGAVVVSSHNLSFAQDVADYILLLNTQPIAFGTLPNVLRQVRTKSLESAYQHLVLEGELTRAH